MRICRFELSWAIFRVWRMAGRKVYHKQNRKTLLGCPGRGLRFFQGGVMMPAVPENNITCLIELESNPQIAIRSTIPYVFPSRQFARLKGRVSEIFSHQTNRFADLFLADRVQFSVAFIE
jgi:hypothetical protein